LFALNQTLKNQPTKLVLETRLPWIKCLPIELLRLRTVPQKDIGLSPYEVLNGLPYLNSVTDVSTFETKDYFLKNHILGLSSTLLSCRKKRLLAQTHPLDFPVHPHQPGNYLLIKTLKENKLETAWEGPFMVLLITETVCPDHRVGMDSSHRGKEGTHPPDQKEQ
jgi:hypothetical protein